MSKKVTATSNAIKGSKGYVRFTTMYNPTGKGFKEALTAAVRQLVSSGEFETVASYNGKDSKLNR